jgi:GxxExxY protein
VRDGGYAIPLRINWPPSCKAQGMLIKSETAEAIIGCAIAVHRALGPGLLESTYQACLRHEFMHAGLPFDTQVAVPVRYRGVQLDCGYRLDFVVSYEIVVEVKSMERTLPIHKAQVLTYLRLTGFPQGLLINFCVPVLRHGITSVVLDPGRRSEEAPSAPSSLV